MIADNVRNVIDDIHDRALRCGRDPSEITLVAIAKTRTVDEINQAIEAGIVHLGENKVQEAQSKIPLIKGVAVWHMVGHLQSNKGKRAASLFDWIDSVDSRKIIDVLSSHTAASGETLNVLIQVNVAGESSKSGVATGEVKELVRYAGNKKGIVVRGLMTIGSFGVSKDVTRTNFARMRSLFESLSTEPDIGSCMGILSMGMSGDYGIAIEEGSTMLRIGTAIFGPRF